MSQESYIKHSNSNDERFPDSEGIKEKKTDYSLPNKSISSLKEISEGSGLKNTEEGFKPSSSKQVQFESSSVERKGKTPNDLVENTKSSPIQKSIQSNKKGLTPDESFKT